MEDGWFEMSGLYEIAVSGFRGLYGLGIHTPPVLDPAAYFPQARELERNWRRIRREADRLIEARAAIPKLHDLHPDQADISDRDAIAWRFLALRIFGRDQAANQALCPETSKLIRALPGALNAGISILDPGKHIPAHRGPYRGYLRYHLGLIIPKDAQGRNQAVLRIAARRYRWTEGLGILWDDTFEHEAWNHGETPRAILIVDVARSGMPAPLRALDRAVGFLVSHSGDLRRMVENSGVGGWIELPKPPYPANDTAEGGASSASEIQPPPSTREPS